VEWVTNVMYRSELRLRLHEATALIKVINELYYYLIIKQYTKYKLLTVLHIIFILRLAALSDNLATISSLN